MSRTEDIDNAIWDEADFAALSAPAKLIYIWSWTNRRCDFSGIYQVPIARLAVETGYDVDTAKAALMELQEAEFVFYDGTWLWCKARVKRIRTRTVQMCKAIVKDLAHVPDPHPFREQFMSLYGDRVWSSKSDRVTLRAVIASQAVGTEEGHGSYPEDGSTKPSKGYDPDGTLVVPGTGTGTGTGTGSSKGGGSGAGKSRHTGGTYAASAEAIRLREQHFPGDDLGTIDGALMMLRGRGINPTPKMIEAFLRPDEDEPHLAVISGGAA